MYQTPEQILKVGNTILIRFSNRIGQLTECNVTIKNLLKGKENKLFLEFEQQDLMDQLHEGSELSISFQGADRKTHIFGTYVFEKKVTETPPLILANPVKVDYTSFRRYIRADVNLPCHCFFHGKSYEGKVINLSGCGLFAVGAITQELTIGTILKYEFILPKNLKPTQILGRIVRVDFLENPIKQGNAVDFDEFVDEYSRMEIVVFVTRLLFEQGKLNSRS